MEDKTPNRIMTVFQLVLAVIMFVCMSITFINHGIIHYRDLFISTMLLLMFILSFWMLRMAYRETRQAFINTK